MLASLFTFHLIETIVSHAFQPRAYTRKILTFSCVLINWDGLTWWLDFLQASEKLLDASNADADDKQEHREEVSGPSHYDFNVMGNSESDSHSSRLTSKNNGEAAWKGSSGVVSDTNSAAASWTLPMQSASPPSQPLFPFPEWNIEFSELRIGVRVGIGLYFRHSISNL